MQIAFVRNGNNQEPNVKDVCISTGNRNVYTKSWSNYGVDSMWNEISKRFSKGVEGDHSHPCVRSGQTITVGRINYNGSTAATKWVEYVSSYSFFIRYKCLLVDSCRNLMLPLIDDIVPKADKELFYGVGKPIGGTLKDLVPELFEDD